MNVNNVTDDRIGAGEESLSLLMTKGGRIVGRWTRCGRIKALPQLEDDPSRTWTAAKMAPVVVDSGGYVVSYTEDDGAIVPLSSLSVDP